MYRQIENPIEFGAFHYLQRRGYKTKKMYKILRDYGAFRGMELKIDFIYIPQLNALIRSDFETFKEWVNENVPYIEQKNKERRIK